MKLLTLRGHTNPDGSFNWAEAMVDAAISACLTFFTSLGGTSATGVPSSQAVVASLIAACTQFFLVLAIKRGIREKEEEER